MENTKTPKDTYRILAENTMINNNTWKTGINNNDLIIGPSGSGKTRGYVIPNILNAEESMIIADTKGNLQYKLGPILADKGYTVMSVDFKEIANSQWGYNPFDFIRLLDDELTLYDEYNEQDICSIAEALSPVKSQKDPFWEQSAQLYLECIISYVLHQLPVNEHNLTSVGKIASLIGTETFDDMMKELEDVEPDCFTIRRYNQMASNRAADRTDACIKAFVFTALNPFDTSDAARLFSNNQRINFRNLSKKKTVVFVNISDTDRSRDTLINLFYTQALQELSREADENIPDCRLQVPVRFILDDFATNTLIPHFDNIISVIRSREIYVSLIIQSISQLEGLYGPAASYTIINNCDNLLYLGGQDVNTARYMSLKLNKPVSSILSLPLDSAYLFTRGSAPKKVQKFIPKESIEATAQAIEEEKLALQENTMKRRNKSLDEILR